MDRRRGIFLPLFFVVICLAGCGGVSEPEKPSMVDQAQLEQLVKEQAEVDSGTVKTVSCPEDVEAQEGDTITCDFVFEGGIAGSADVQVTSDAGDISLDPKDLTFAITD